MNPTPRILLIDDDSQLRLLATHLIEKEFPGCRVDTITDPAAFEGVLTQADYDLVITDYHLGWINGLTVLRQVKARYPDCPVIMFTGTGSEEIAVEAMKAGLDDYVLKSPPHRGRLTASVRRVLEDAEQRRELRERDARMRSLFHNVLDSSAAGVIVLDARCKVVWVNAAVEGMFGVRRADMLEMDTRELIRSRLKLIFEDPEGFEGHILDSYETARRIEGFECHVLAGDGRKECWLEHHSLPIESGPFAGGRVEHYYDVTARKQAEDALRASEARFSGAFAQTAIGMALVAPDGRWLKVNRALCDLTGYSEEELQGRTFQEITYPDDLEADLEYVRRLLAGEIPHYHMEKRYIHKQGHTIWILLSVSLVRDVQGRPMHFVSQIQDITERKRIQAALQETADRLTALIQASPMAIVALDLNGAVQLWNPAAEHLFGWTREEAIGRPLPIVPKERQEEHRRLLERSAGGEALQNLELVRMRKNETPVMVSLSTAPLRDPEGRFIGVLGMMADITERKQMQAEAARLDRMSTLSQLLSGIAHSLKNPLFIVTGYLQLAQEKLAKGEYGTLPAELGKIQDAAARMTQVLGRVQDLTQPYHPNRERCAVPRLLTRTLEFLSHDLMTHNVQVVTHYADGLPEILADVRLLQGVFFNLSLNAVQAMYAAHGGGTLTVTASLASPELPSAVAASSGRIEIRIQDDGPGIPKEDWASLFEPFFSIKPGKQAAGIGLWTVRSSLMAMNGSIDFETAPETGTTFILRLPVIGPANDGACPPPPAAS